MRRVGQKLTRLAQLSGSHIQQAMDTMLANVSVPAHVPLRARAEAQMASCGRNLCCIPRVHAAPAQWRVFLPFAAARQDGGGHNARGSRGSGLGQDVSQQSGHLPLPVGDRLCRLVYAGEHR